MDEGAAEKQPATGGQALDAFDGSRERLGHRQYCLPRFQITYAADAAFSAINA
jgi:hypothetical protein